MKNFRLLTAVLLLSVLLALLFITGCTKFVVFGSPSGKINQAMISKKGEIIFQPENLKMKYIITGLDDLNSNDLIFYFHGLGTSELEWAEADGFGEIYYDVLKQKKEYKHIPVVAISLGAAYFFIEDAPAPFSADLETLFIKKIIPHFKNLLNKSGNVYLMGHSMGGYNVLTLSLRNPELFPVNLAVSPYAAPISPFSKKFEEKGRELGMPKFQVNRLKAQLTSAFKTEKKWDEYNPFFLVKNYDKKKAPYIVLSQAKYDLPGFAESINDFSNLLKEKGIPSHHCESAGDHRTTCMTALSVFLDKISK
jgi:pimeloyl-ACP methyl ester carboxylesterase